MVCLLVVYCLFHRLRKITLINESMLNENGASLLQAIIILSLFVSL